MLLVQGHTQFPLKLELGRAALGLGPNRDTLAHKARVAIEAQLFELYLPDPSLLVYIYIVGRGPFRGANEAFTHSMALYGTQFTSSICPTNAKSIVTALHPHQPRNTDTLIHTYKRDHYVYCQYSSVFTNRTVHIMSWPVLAKYCNWRGGNFGPLITGFDHWSGLMVNSQSQRRRVVCSRNQPSHTPPVWKQCGKENKLRKTFIYVYYMTGQYVAHDSMKHTHLRAAQI